MYYGLWFKLMSYRFRYLRTAQNCAISCKSTLFAPSGRSAINSKPMLKLDTTSLEENSNKYNIYRNYSHSDTRQASHINRSLRTYIKLSHISQSQYFVCEIQYKKATEDTSMHTEFTMITHYFILVQYYRILKMYVHTVEYFTLQRILQCGHTF